MSLFCLELPFSRRVETQSLPVDPMTSLISSLNHAHLAYSSSASEASWPSLHPPRLCNSGSLCPSSSQFHHWLPAQMPSSRAPPWTLHLKEQILSTSIPILFFFLALTNDIMLHIYWFMGFLSLPSMNKFEEARTSFLYCVSPVPRILPGRSQGINKYLLIERIHK